MNNLSLNNKNNISFKGYDVRPLKGLYVQGFCKPDELKIFSELKSIAKQEKFNLVFNQNNTKLSKNIDKQQLQNFDKTLSIWGQDNKAFLINKCERYDVRGKRILSGKYKYYLTDLGLGQVVNNEKKKQMGAYLENVVYNELLSRGYEVNVGTFDSGEIDFIATRFNEKIYVQVAYILSDEKVCEREFGVYKNINDNYPKYVITTDTMDFSQDGIVHKNIIDWLLDK